MTDLQENEKGYVIATCDDSDFYIADALHIERNDSLNPWLCDDDEEAAKAAEQDGVKLVYGMDGVEDGIYLDTPDNRRVLENALRENSRKPSILETMKKINAEIAAAPHAPERSGPSKMER